MSRHSLSVPHLDEADNRDLAFEYLNASRAPLTKCVVGVRRRPKSWAGSTRGNAYSRHPLRADGVGYTLSVEDSKRKALIRLQ